MHRSRVFLYVLISFILGVGVRSFFEVPYVIISMCAVVGAFLLVFWYLERQRVLLGITGALLVFFTFGMVRFSWQEAARENATVISFAGEQAVTLRGVMEDIPDVREKNTRLVIRVSEVLPSEDDVWRVASGRVLVFVNRYPVFEYGDELEVRGMLEIPEEFSGFDYPAYLAKDGIYTLMYYPDTELVSSGNGSSIKRYLFFLRQELEESMERVLPEPHAAFLKGILLGSRASIPQWLLDAFQVTGVTHIIALSGFNITIIADSISRMLRRFSVSPTGTFWTSFLFISLFTMMVGASPSIVRASLMGALVLLAAKEGRQYQGPNALTFAGAVMILQNPSILRFDVAFQLSFLATAGLLFVAPRLGPKFSFLPEMFGFRNNLLTTISAQLTVLPLLLYTFGAVSLVSPVSNMLILSLMPLTMLFGFLAALMGMGWAGAGVLAGGIAYVCISYHIWVVTVLSAVPFAMISF